MRSLPVPVFTGDEHGRIGVGDDASIVQHTFQGRAVADDIVGRVRAPDFVLQIALFLGQAFLEFRDLAIGMCILQRGGDLIGYLLQIFNLRRAESILDHATRIQGSPDLITRDQGHTANRPNSAFIHGFRQGFVHLV